MLLMEKFRVKELNNGLFIAEKKDSLFFYHTLSYSKKSKELDQWIPTTFSTKENAEAMIEYFKFYENYLKDNNIKKNPHSIIFLDENDLLEIIENNNLALNEDELDFDLK